MIRGAKNKLYPSKSGSKDYAISVFDYICPKKNDSCSLIFLEYEILRNMF